MGCFSAKSQGTVDGKKPTNAPAASGTKEPTGKTGGPAPAANTSKSASPKPSGKVTYHYFDVLGRGEVIRLLLHHLNVPFEDHRFGFEEWMKLKSTAEFGTCPILEVDGHKLVQTRAILRYLAQKHGLYPKGGPKEVYLFESFCDEIADARENLIEHSVHQKVDELAIHYAEMPRYLGYLESRLKKNPANSGWVIGTQATLADISLFDLLWNWFLCPQRKAQYGHLVPERLKVYSDFFLAQYPKTKEYVTNREARPY